ncbi:hypothetical protein [Lacrimispora sp.]|nr:hypothetical protein [Lacrimispora sp.]
MNRIEKVREYVDDVLLNISDTAKKKIWLFAFIWRISELCNDSHEKE